MLAAVLACALTGPARADATTDIQSKVDAAMKGAKSYVVTTLYPAQAYASTLVFVAPDRSRVDVAVNASTTDVVTVGGVSYSSKNGATFERASATPDQLSRLRASANVKVGAVQPDVVVGGVTYGAFQTTVPLGTAQTLTCTYDKKTFRLARCSNDDVTQTYDGYDDPKNVVDTPANFVNAPEAPKEIK